MIGNTPLPPFRLKLIYEIIYLNFNQIKNSLNFFLFQQYFYNYIYFQEVLSISMHISISENSLEFWKLYRHCIVKKYFCSDSDCRLLSLLRSGVVDLGGGGGGGMIILTLSGRWLSGADIDKLTS